MKYINGKKPILVNKNEKEVFKKPISIIGTKNNIVVECSFEWNAGYSEDVLPFTNKIPQKDGGTHLLGFRSALTRVINKYSNDRSSKKNKLSLVNIYCPVCQNDKFNTFQKVFDDRYGEPNQYNLA